MYSTLDTNVKTALAFVVVQQ